MGLGDPDGSGTLTGLDLKVGGEGMRGFYDQILPSAANKLVKRWGGRVGETNIPVRSIGVPSMWFVRRYGNRATV